MRNIPLVRYIAEQIGQRLDEVALPLPTTDELEALIEQSILEWGMYRRKQ